MLEWAVGAWIHSRGLSALLALLIAIPAPSLAATCPLGWLVHTSLGRESKYTLQQFEKDLELFEPSAWKRKLLLALWSSQVKRGHQLIDLRPASLRPGADGKLWLPYALDLPRDMAATLVAAATAKGITPGERFLIIPAKLLLSEGIRKFYKNLFLILSLGAGGKILGSLGVAVSDPLIDQTDPSTLDEDEVILLVKFGDDKPRDGRAVYSNMVIASQIRYLKSNYPTKFIVLDLSNDGSGALTSEKRVAEVVAELAARHKRVRKIIVGSHGQPGIIEGDKIGSVGVESLPQLLGPIKPYFSAKTEAFFGACLVGGSEFDRKSVDRFADQLFPEGSAVTVQRLKSVYGIGSPDAMVGTRAHSADRLFIARAQRILTPINPVVGESIGLAIQGFTNFEVRADTQVDWLKYGTDPLIFFEPTTYRHVVGKPQPAPPPIPIRPK